MAILPPIPYQTKVLSGALISGDWLRWLRELKTQAETPGGGGTTVITVPTGGTGTAGKLPKWATGTTLADSILSEAGGVLSVAGTVSVTGQFTGSGAGLTGVPAASISGLLPWASVNKTGSSLADLATRSAGDLSSGNLALARMPSADGTWTIANLALSGNLEIQGGGNILGAGTVGGNLTVGGHVLPSLTDSSDLGSVTRLFRVGYITKLESLLFELQTQTLFGGYSTIGKQAGAFAAAVGSGDTTIDFGQAVTPNDWVLVRARDTSGAVRHEYMQIGTLVGGSTYNVTRDLGASYSPDPAYAAGTPYLVLGASGDGRIDLLAADGKPRIVFTTQGGTYSGQSDRVVIGNLNGYFGYASDLYGFVAGDPAGSYIKIDPTNGLRLGYNSGGVGDVVKVQIDASGNATFTDKITAGSGNDLISISAVDATYRFWIGHATAGSAPFRVTKAGAVTASNVTITAGGVTIDSGGITLGNTGTWAAYTGGNALKFGRPSANNFGQTDDHYGVYTINNGSAEWIYLANEIKGLGAGSGGTDGNARIYLRAAGWDSTGAGSQTTAVQIELRSGLESGADRITLTAGSVVQTGLLDLSGASAGQIRFPSTQNASADANTLDDYEEGTFTATLTAATPPSTPPTATAKYTKIGNRVFLDVAFDNANTSGGAGAMSITGIPAALTIGTEAWGTLAVHGFTWTGGYAAATAQAGTNTILFYGFTSGGAWTQMPITAGTGKYMRVSICYQV